METNRIVLRRLILADSHRIAELANNKNITRNTLSLPHPYTLDDAKTWIGRHEDNFKENRVYDYGIIDKASNKVVGVVGLSNYENHRGELGYWIGESYWNQGYASEASNLILKHAFENLGYNRVYARHIASNPNSGKVMQKIGMTYEGLQVEHERVDGKFEDILLYGITKSQYTKK